jgi:hypothetical protein
VGYSVDSFSKEERHRADTLQQKFARKPTEVELRKACYPYGPEKIDIFVCGGRMQTDLVLPSLLGPTDLYFLSHIEFDLTEQELRNILYDYLFCRNANYVDYMRYTPESIMALKEYYDKHRNCVLGLGEIIGNIKWHPNHSCSSYQPSHELLQKASNLKEEV